MKYIKRIILLIAVVFATTLQAQTKTFNKQVTVKQVPLSSSLDSLVTINSSGLLTYLPKSELASGGALEFITEGGNTGIAIKGRNPDNYGDIGDNAVDLSFSNSASSTKGATGDYSFVTGLNNTGGNFSLVFGAGNEGGIASLISGADNSGLGYSLVSGNFNTGDIYSLVSGAYNSGDNYSLVSGLNNTGGTNSLVSGQNNEGSNNSMVSGIYNTAPSYSESAMGMYGTDYTPNSTSSYDSGDRLFNLGNGTSVGNRSDALTVYKSGNATLNGDLTADKFIGDGSSLTNVDAATVDGKDVNDYLPLTGGTLTGGIYLEKYNNVSMDNQIGALEMINTGSVRSNYTMTAKDNTASGTNIRLQVDNPTAHIGFNRRGTTNSALAFLWDQSNDGGSIDFRGGDFLENYSSGQYSRISQIGDNLEVFNNLNGDVLFRDASIAVGRSETESTNSGSISLIEDVTKKWGIDAAGFRFMLNGSTNTFHMLSGNTTSILEIFEVKRNSGDFSFNVTTSAPKTITDVLQLTPTTQPSSPVKGMVYYDSVTDLIRYYNGTVWVTL
tara:strand:+ start:6056 stop:7720 length:1665 start_codon:yes stop_codon:yes gene_type:complete